MGQYFIAVNEDKREWIHPHRFGDGLKFLEFSGSSSGFLAGLALLLKQGSSKGYDTSKDKRYAAVGSWAGDSVTIVGDYDDTKLYQTAMDNFRDVSFDIMRVMVMDPHVRVHLAEAVKWYRATTELIGNERVEYAELFGEVTKA